MYIKGGPVTPVGELTAILVQSHTGEVVTQNLGVGIVAVVVVAPAGAAAFAAAMVRLCLAARGLRLVFLGIVLAIDALLKIREPRVDLGLGLHEALAEVLPDHGQLVVDEVGLALVLLVGHEALLTPGLLLLSGAAAVPCPVLVGAHVVVVLGELPRVELVGLDLRHGSLGARWARRLRGRDLALLRNGVVLDGVGVAHAQQGVEGRVDAAAARNQDGLDDGHLDSREGLLEHRLVLLLLRHGSGRLRGGLLLDRGGQWRGRGSSGSGRGRGGGSGRLLMGAAVAQDAGLLNVVIVVGHLERLDGSGRLRARVRHGLLVLRD